MNRKAISLGFKFILPMFVALLLAVYVVPALAATNVSVVGDLPDDSSDYVIRAYDGPSAEPCSANSGTLVDTTTAHATATDPANDNNDYLLSISSVSDLYIYFCQSYNDGDLRLTYHKGAVSSDTTYYVDLGKVVGTTLHPDLNGDRVIVCDALGGSEISSERFSDNEITAGSYTQFYYIDQGTTGDPVNSNAYVLFDIDTNSASCSNFDLTIEAGRKIRLNSSDEKYGVYVTFAPDTKAIGDAHNDMDADRGEIYKEGSDTNLGIVYIPDGRCEDTAHDDYTLYYDKPLTSGTLRLDLYEDTGNNKIEDISNLDLNMGTQDFIVKIYGNIPSNIDRVEATDNNSVTYSVVADNSFAVYIADNHMIESPITLNFYEGSTLVHSFDINVPNQTSDCGQDIEISFAVVSGEAHSDLETGDDTLQVFDDAQCTNAVSLAVNPVNDPTGPDYVIYFTDTNNPGPYYMEAVMNDNGHTYTSCGNAFTLGSSEITGHNITAEVWGYVPDSSTGIQTIGISLDNGYQLNYRNNDVYGQIDTTTNPPEYHIFSVPDEDGNSTVNLYKKPDYGNALALYRTKNITTDSEITVPLHAAKLKGSLATGFTGGSRTNRVYVYSEFEESYDGMTQSNLACDDSVFSGSPYIHGADAWNLYFEVTPANETQGVLDDGDVAVRLESDSGYYAWRTKIDKDPTTATLESLRGGEDIDNFDLIYETTGTTHTDIRYIELSDASGWIPAVAETNGNNPRSYWLIYDALTASSGNWQYNAHVNPVVLERDQGDDDSTNLDNGVFNVGKLQGETHANMESGDDTIEVYDTFDTVTGCSGVLSSETVNPADDAGVDYEQYFEADSSNPTTTDYYVQAEMNDNGNTYTSCGNVFQINAQYEATKDLEIDKTGAVPSSITRVGADLNQDSIDDVITWPAVNLYHLFTVTDDSVDVHYYDAGGLLFTLPNEDWSSAGTVVNNVDVLAGDVDDNLNGGLVLLYTYPGGGCFGPDDVDNDIIDTIAPGSPDYNVFMKADGTRYYAVFCDAGNNKVFEWKVDSSATGGNVWTMDVGEIIGEAHSNLEDANDLIEVYDSPDGISCDESVKLSTETVNPSDNSFYNNADYAQFFLQRLIDNSENTDYTNDFCKKIIDDDTAVSGNVYTTWHIFSTTEYGDTVTEDLDALKYGTVTEELGNVLFNVSITKTAQNVLAWTYTKTDGTYRLYDSAGVYDILYEKAGWVDYLIDDETLTEESIGDTQNDVSLDYTIKIETYDELGNIKYPANVTLDDGANTWDCTDGDAVALPPETMSCDADNTANGHIYWAFDPSVATNVDALERLDGYVDWTADSLTITDQQQLIINTTNLFTIRVIDVYDELGNQLAITDSSGGLAPGEADVSVSDPARIAVPTGINYANGMASTQGDPRGDDEQDLFLPVMTAGVPITLTAFAPGYIDETIDVVPDNTRQQTVMWGDADRQCDETTDADYCDDDRPQRIDGDGLIYTLRLDIWDEKLTNTSHRIKEPVITLNPYDSFNCYAPYIDLEPSDPRYSDPSYDYDNDGIGDEFPHVDYIYDPATEMYYIPAMGHGCQYYLQIRKDGYVMRGDSAHGIITRPDEALSTLTLDQYPVAINFSKNVTCDQFSNQPAGDNVIYEQCSGMPFSLRVNAYDQKDHVVEGFTVVVEDSGMTLPPSETDMYFCWTPVEVVYDDENNEYKAVGIDSYKQCVENGGTVRPLGIWDCASYAFDKEIKEEPDVYDFGFCLGDYSYYAWWNTLGRYNPDNGYSSYWTPVGTSDGDYCIGFQGGMSYLLKPGFYVDILNGSCNAPVEGQMAMRVFLSSTDYDLSGLGYTNTFIITDGERGWNSSINRSIEQWWLPDYSWEDGPNGIVFYPLNTLTGPVDNPLHIHISKPGYEAYTKDNVIVDSVYQVEINAILVDNKAPEVQIVSPSEGDAVAGMVNIIADVIEDGGAPASNVTFYYDSVEIGVDANYSDSRWNVLWNTTLVADGYYSLKAVVTDINGYTTASDIVVVHVDSGRVAVTSATSVSPTYASTNPSITAYTHSQINGIIESAKYCLRRPWEDRPARDETDNCYYFNAQDGSFDENVEMVEAMIDISTLGEGEWDVYSNARDSAGWGEYDEDDFTVDRVAPIIDEKMPDVVEGDADCTEVYNAGCTGTPEPSCLWLGDVWGQFKCEETNGCLWEAVMNCTGTPEPDSCLVYTENQCGLFANCTWDTDGYCSGDVGCWAFDTAQACHDEGCEWVEDPGCTGTPVHTCEDIQSIGKDNGYDDKCEETPGCEWETIDHECNGEPDTDSCNAYDPEQCLLIDGCAWHEDSYAWNCEGGTTFDLMVETSENAYCEYSTESFNLGQGTEFEQGQWTDQHITSVSVDEDGEYVYHVICKDYASLESSTTINVLVDSVHDKTPPILVNSSPTGVVNTNEIMLTAETDEYAHCEFDTKQFEYGSGTPFEYTGSNVHMQPLTLADGYYIYHIKCADYRDNVMPTTEEIVFAIDTDGNFGFAQDMVPGWNTFFLPKLILDNLSFSCVPGNNTYYVDDVLDSIDGVDPAFDVIWYYDGSEWLMYAPGYEFNDLLVFDDEISNPYFIKMNRFDRIEIGTNDCS